MVHRGAITPAQKGRQQKGPAGISRGAHRQNVRRLIRKLAGLGTLAGGSGGFADFRDFHLSLTSFPRFFLRVTREEVSPLGDAPCKTLYGIGTVNARGKLRPVAASAPTLGEP